jgi:transcriptional regulator with XRE-family HTH domain
MEFQIEVYIKGLRNSSGKTLKDVAEVLNMDLADLSKIENGQRKKASWPV